MPAIGCTYPFSSEKAMAPHSSTLAWKIPRTEEPGRLQSMGSLSWTWLSDFTLTFHFHALEKETATHSSVLAWRIPVMGEPSGLPSMGSHRVGHDCSDLAAAAVPLQLSQFPGHQIRWKLNHLLSSAFNLLTQSCWSWDLPACMNMHRTVVLEKTLENPLDCKEFQPVHPKGNQPWIFIGRTDTEAPVLWPPDAKSQLIGEDLDAGKDWRQEDKGATEDEIVRWHHWLNGHEFEQALGDSEGQGSLVCCSL